MSKNDVAAPVCSAPSDRMALGVGWARPGAAAIGGTRLGAAPAYNKPIGISEMCFAGAQE